MQRWSHQGSDQVLVSLKDVDAAENGELSLGQSLSEPKKWHHMAIVRNEQNEIRLLVDGKAEAGKKVVKFDGAFDFESVAIVAGQAGGHLISIDEFCVFDRGLSNDEVSALAGRKELQNSKK